MTADSKPPILTREQASDLIARYPHVTDAETKLILTFLRKGRHLDLGILSADESLKPQLESFTADHAKHLRVGIGEASALVAAIAGFLALCWLVWEAVKPAGLSV
jgi:hypothetical protein